MPSPIVVSGLVITPGFGQTFAEWAVDDPNWNGIEQLRLDRVELWSATSNDRAVAVKVAEGITEAIHRISDGVARWYWIKARNRAGIYSEWYPSSASAGISAAATASIGATGYARLPSGLFLQWGATVAQVTSTLVVSFPLTFPSQCFGVSLSPNSGGLAGTYRHAWPYDIDTAGFTIQGVTFTDVGTFSSVLGFATSWEARGR